MSKTELREYETFAVKYQGEVCLEEASQQEAQDFIDRGVESGKERNDFELIQEDVIEIVPPGASV